MGDSFHSSWCTMQYFVLISLLVAYALATCVSPPSDLNVCVLPNSARVPQEYATTNADVELQSYFAYLDMIDQTPTHKCAEAYIEFACSERYPRCSGDANSGLGY